MRTQEQAAARKLRAVLRRRWARVVLAGLVLTGVVSGTFWTAHHAADSVTITITRYGSASAPSADMAALSSSNEIPTTVYTATITDPAKARAIQALWNETRTYSPFATFNCATGGSPYIYAFRFSFLGLPMQELKASRGGCGFFRLTTLGMSSPFPHAWPNRDAWRQLLRLTGMPDFSVVAQPPA
ncbi:MAG TPA: hypothetical protein VFY89_09810 [Ktedonobacterales bacterium]